MSNEVQRTENSLPSIARVWCRNHQKELLTTLLAIAAIGAVLLSIHALSYAGLSGLNSLSGAAVISTAIFLIVLSAYCFYKRNDSGPDPIPESSKEEIAAATIIQRAYRKHIARLAEKLKNERDEAAISIQSAFRRHFAQSELQALQIEAELKAQKSVPKFSSHGTDVILADGRKKSFYLQREDDVEPMIKEIRDEIYQHQGSIKVYFDWSLWDSKEKMECYQRAPSAANLLFSMHKDNLLYITAKPLSIKDFGNGKTRSIFANDTVEIFRSKNEFYRTGTRVFPDGRQEKGKFDINGKLCSGYRMGVDKQIEFRNPRSFVSYSASKSTTLKICEAEGKLVVLEDCFGESENIVSTVSVREALIKASDRTKPGFLYRSSIKKILLHKDFEDHLNPFLEYALGTEESGMPRLFGFSDAVIIDLLGLKFKDIDPLKIIDHATNRNIFIQAAHWGSEPLLNKLADLFPREYKKNEQEIVAEFLRCGHRLVDFIKAAELDAYHSMWLQVAKKEKPDDSFKKEFALLSPAQQRTLYDAAFIYKNSFVYEPADSPVRADQYSINLMWIEKPADQEILFKEKISWIAGWATANPGSTINIWFDGEMMSSGAIDKAKQALSDHGFVNFKDVRSIDIVRNNAAVFGSGIPHQFRRDLLRAIAADDVLRRKETQYVVCSDIYMEPLAGEELFDKKTLGFLDNFGIVMAKEGPLSFDNYFQILNGNHTCMDSHRKVIIDLNIEMALEVPNIIKEHQIHDTYPAMFTHLLIADGHYGKLNFDRQEGDEIFRYDIFGSSAHTILPLAIGDDKIYLRDIVPTKPVRYIF